MENKIDLELRLHTDEIRIMRVSVDLPTGYALDRNNMPDLLTQVAKNMREYIATGKDEYEDALPFLRQVV